MKWKALVAVIGVLLVGLVSGALLGRFYLGPYRAKGKLERKHIQKFSEELGLSKKQRAKIAPSLNEARQELHMIRLESFDKADQVIAKLEDRIRPHLKPEQNEKLDDLARNFRERRKHKRERIMRKMGSLRGSGSSR
jgi:hypothetical protein